MDKYYKKLSSFLSKNNTISKNDEELYEYAIKVVIHAIVNIGVTILIGLLFGMLKECVCLFITFFSLRKVTGGLHLKKYINCLACSTVIISLTLVIIKHYNCFFDKQLFIIMVCISIIVISILSPLENTNKPILYLEKFLYKLISIVLSVVFLIISVILLQKDLELGYSFGLGLILTTILLIIGKLKNNYKIISE